MGRYIKRHRRPIVGAACPIFFIIILVVVGLSVFPGWIHRTYGTPGNSCSIPFDTLAWCFDTNPSPLLFNCNVCNGEFCSVVNATATEGTCAVISGGTTTFDPAAKADPEFLPCRNPGSKGLPGCWTSCREILTDGSVDICEMAACEPNDSFCVAPADSCRHATCQTSPTPNPTNISGCSYSDCEKDSEISAQAPQTPLSDKKGMGSEKSGLGCSLIKDPLSMTK